MRKNEGRTNHAKKNEVKKTKRLTMDTLPEVMDVRDVENFLGIGINQSYQLCNSGAFHVGRAGKRILISKVAFLKWFVGEDNIAV